MGLQIPDELAGLLKEMGYNWPESDEEKMYQLGQSWLDFAGTTEQTAQDATTAVGTLPESNTGTAMSSFWAQWDKDDSVIEALHDATTGAKVLGGALIVCAAVVLVLKINVILQLTKLAIEIAMALAAAAATYGASLARIPVAKKLSEYAINILIDKAVETVLGD